MSACPSGVQYDRLIEATRPQIERLTRRPLTDRLFRKLVFWVFPHPARLWWVTLGIWLYQTFGLRYLAHITGLLNSLPARLQALEATAPPVTFRTLWTRFPEHVRPQGQPRKRVGLILGCVQRMFFDEVNQATARVLAAEGYEVVTPREQGCCGALPMHAGIEGTAETMARRTIDVFETAGVDTIVVNAAGCGSMLKQYGHLLRDDPDYAERAVVFAGKCKDISEVLAETSPQAPRHPVPLRVAYHDACHLKHAQAISDAPRQVLATVPNLTVHNIPEGDLCCGSAGIYSLLEPQTASNLGQRKARNILSIGADAVISSNPGCLLQLRRSLAEEGRPLTIRHLVEIIDASIRGMSIEAIAHQDRGLDSADCEDRTDP